MSSVVHTADHGAVRVITMDRPAARNALSGELIVALYDALVGADADPAVHVVVLTGTDPAFCAGVDLKEAARDGLAYFARFRETDCIGQTGRMATPVIGAINGATFTGGLELALGCDFLIASTHARFGDTHARVGVLPGGGMTARLPLAVGTRMARQLSYTGQVIDADTAARLGLVNEVVPHEELLPRCLELAGTIAEIDPAIIGQVKRMYQLGEGCPTPDALRSETAIAAEWTIDVGRLADRRDAVIARNRDQLTDP